MPISQIIVDTRSGEKVPTTFSNYIVVPKREDVQEFITWLQGYYDSHTDEEIETINQKAEAEWEEESYKPVHRDKKPHPNARPGYVYLIQSEAGNYKIGLTVNPDNRQKTFGIKLPFRVEYICLISTDNMKQLEEQLHEQFKAKRLDGEWFNLEAADIDYIKSLAVQND